jgi:hypothetical protein
MDKAEEKDEPVLATELSPEGLRPAVRRSVRRKLVQSTLFPPKPQEREENGDQKGEKSCGEDEDGEEAEFCGSQSKKRKPKGKAMPQPRASKKVNYGRILMLNWLNFDNYCRLRVGVCCCGV